MSTALTLLTIEVKWLIKILARYDFNMGSKPRLNNKTYLNEYGNCYALAECQDYITGYYQ